MRFTVLAILILASMHPLLTQTSLDDEEKPYFTADGKVDVIQETEPNNLNTTGQEVYPGDVIRGSVDMWSDELDYFGVWLEPGQTLLLTLSHAAGDGVSMSVWDEEGTHLSASNPGKTRDTLFLGEDETDYGGLYIVSVNATMTEAGGGAYVLEIDAGYLVHWYAPQIGWNAATEMFDAKGNLLYTESLSSYQFAESTSSTASSAPTWTAGDFWNFSVTMPSMMGVDYNEYHQMTVTGTETVSGNECYRVSLEGKMTFSMSFFGMTTTTTEEETGVACYATSDLSLMHENLTFTSKIETSGGFGAMSSDETSGRSCTTSDGEPDEDCDDVEDFFDDCPGTTTGAEVDFWGCSDAQNGGGNGNDDGGDDGSGNGGSDATDADGDGVSDDDDMCPDTMAGASVDMMGCSNAQNGGGNNGGDDGSGNGGNDGDDGSGNGGDDGSDGIDPGFGCIPDMSDLTSTTEVRSNLIYAQGIDHFHFPIEEGTVWSESAVGDGSISMSSEMGGCELFSIEVPVSDALPLNYRHLSTKDFTVGNDSVTANGIQVFAGREGNNDWATPDFTLLQSVPDNVAKMGLPFAAWVNVVGFNEFNTTVNMSASINAENAPIMFDGDQLTVDNAGTVVVDTMNLSSGEYLLTVTGSSNGGAERSITIPFTVDNDPDFEILSFDPWIVLPQGVEWVVPTPIFIEPVNGFGADVSVSVTVPDGMTAQLDFARGSAPFMSVLTLTIPANFTAGDYTVIVTGTAGNNVHSDEITFTLTSLPEFSLEIEEREQIITNGAMTISGVINAHNGLNLALGGALDIFIEPYNQALLDSAVIEFGTMTQNGNLPFTVIFTVNDTTDRNEYTVNLNVVALDGGVTHMASVAFVTESSTLDGTAVAADASAVVTGNTSQHDGSEDAAQAIANGEEVEQEDQTTDGDTKDDSSSDTQSSNTALVVGSTIGILGIVVGVAVVLMRRRDDGTGQNFNQPQWNQPSAQSMPVQADMAPMPDYATVQQPVQHMQPVQHVQQVQEVQPLQVASPVAPVQPTAVPTPAPVATAPPPPAQPTTVADYTGLPPGGSYDQSTGQTIYIQADGVRWQMMGDGSFNRL
tara:strand:- start:408 stop:3668 length:3261 start_codon:yes stop_codon:yes gene_type:complete